MDIARGGNIESCGAYHGRWEAHVVSLEIYEQLDDTALPCACDQVSAYMPSFQDGVHTCLSYKRHETWKSMVTRTECSVTAVA